MRGDRRVTDSSPEDKLQALRKYARDLTELARAGKKRIAVIAPGFAADCVETLEEINDEIREAFLHAGGEEFTYIPCLNDADAHIDMIEEIVRTEGQGWL